MKIGNVKRQEILLMASVLLAEACGEGKEGMQMVGEVIINRVMDNRFPNTITDVICQPNQFSCLKLNSKDYSLITDVFLSDEYLDALEVAVSLVKGNYTPLLDLNVTAFHSGPRPQSKYWNLLELKKEFKNHKFYA